ncbi:MAG: hypothetical protein RLN76_03305 [Phycisphaeraceae bacterium]
MAEAIELLPSDAVVLSAIARRDVDGVEASGIDKAGDGCGVHIEFEGCFLAGQEGRVGCIS